MIMMTITRMSGIKLDGQVDQVWETYFIVLAAEIGIVLVAVSAFRSFFVSRQRRADHRAKNPSDDRTFWPSLDRSFLKQVFTLQWWRSKSRSYTSFGVSEGDDNGKFALKDLPNIPRAHMTGVQKFIDGQEKESFTPGVMESQVFHENEDTRPFRKIESNRV